MGVICAKTELAKEVDKGDGIEKALKKIWDSFGRNALHAAAASGNDQGKLDVCKYLVEELNFNVNEQDANGIFDLEPSNFSKLIS